MSSRAWWMPIIGVVAAISTIAIVDGHVYRVSLIDPHALPDRVQACGRSYRAAVDVTSTDAETVDAQQPGRARVQPIGKLHAWLYQPLTIYGRPGEPACGVSVFVGPGPEHLAAYELMGGP